MLILGVVTFSEAQQQAVDSSIGQLRFNNNQYEKLNIKLLAL